jgi:hypothetical protein
MTTNFSEQTFGVEIETVALDVAGACEAVARATGGRIYNPERPMIVMADGRRWTVVRDGSLHSPNGRSCEVVSPICTAADLSMVQEVVRALKARGAQVNATCGVHVHVGVPGVTGKELASLAKVVDRQEEYMFAALGVLPHRRARYARPVEAALIQKIEARKPKTALEFKKIWYGLDHLSDQDAESYSAGHYSNSRYHGLNLHAVWDKGTVEYRYFNGSLHPGKIKAYIQFCMALTAYGRGAKFAKAGRRPFSASTAKYDFRCFLLTLKLIGPEYAVCRLHMTARLAGDSAYQHGRPLAQAA